MTQKIKSTLYLDQLKLNIHLGWPTAERRQKQTVWLDIQIQFEKPPKACETDELEETWCYDQLTKKIKHHIQKKQFRLIEYFAREIYLIVKEEIADAAINICVTKKPPIKNLSKARFCYGDEF